MQVKKFEAPTIQEALENVKRELGPEAIILQTKKNKRGFGLLSKASIEVTAAISERSLQKKQGLEGRIPEQSRAAMRNLPAEKQADIIDKYMDRNLTQAKQTKDSVEVSSRGKRITATRYIDIEDSVDSTSRKQPDLTSSRPSEKLARSAEKAAIRTSASSAPLAPSAYPSPLSASSSPPVLPPTSIPTMEEEIRSLKKVIEELRTSRDALTEGASLAVRIPGGADSSTLPALPELPELQDAFEQLVLHGVDRRYAYNLIKKVSFEMGNDRGKRANSEYILDCLASELMHTIEVQSLLSDLRPGGLSGKKGPTVVALVGPTGTGKTATIAKLASEAQTRGQLRVSLINLDFHKTTGFDQLGTYAKILNVPFRSAASQEDFAAAIHDFQGFDLVLVDTCGFSQKSQDSIKRTSEILYSTSRESVTDLRVSIVLSATTREGELVDAVNRFSLLKPRGIVVSKLDEATIYGPIYNVLQRVKLPLVYFTTGQRIPEDIEVATRERLVSLVMDIV